MQKIIVVQCVSSIFRFLPLQCLLVGIFVFIVFFECQGSQGRRSRVGGRGSGIGGRGSGSRVAGGRGFVTPRFTDLQNVHPPSEAPPLANFLLCVFRRRINGLIDVVARVLGFLCIAFLFFILRF